MSYIIDQFNKNFESIFKIFKIQNNKILDLETKCLMFERVITLLKGNSNIIIEQNALVISIKISGVSKLENESLIDIDSIYFKFS